MNTFLIMFCLFNVSLYLPSFSTQIMIAKKCLSHLCKLGLSEGFTFFISKTMWHLKMFFFLCAVWLHNMIILFLWWRLVYHNYFDVLSPSSPYKQTTVTLQFCAFLRINALKLNHLTSVISEPWAINTDPIKNRSYCFVSVCV